jgi:hypothetical protein
MLLLLLLFFKARKCQVQRNKTFKKKTRNDSLSSS